MNRRNSCEVADSRRFERSYLFDAMIRSQCSCSQGHTQASGSKKAGAVLETPVSVELVNWSVEGTYFEACNCLPICPCRQIGGRDGGRSSFGVCDFALSWWVKTGHAADINLEGRQVVMVGTYSDDDAGSPWTVALFIDDHATSVQQNALADIFLGRAGGTPSRNYTPAIASVAGVHTARVELDHRRHHWRIRVEGHVDVRADEEVDSDETVACGIPGLDRPGQELRTAILKVDNAPLVWEWSDRCGFATNFAYRADS